MDKFVASNGVSIRVQEGAALELRNVPGVAGWLIIENHVAEDLREFFLHERDQELGRWRWPQDPDYVVYPHEDGDFALVVSDASGDSFDFYRDGERHTGSNFERAASAYFAANPEPKPWHEAKPGEVWELTFTPEGSGGTEPWTVDRARYFTHPNYVNRVAYTDTTIGSGKRIWPEMS